MNFEIYCDESGLEALSHKDAHLYTAIGGILSIIVTVVMPVVKLRSVNTVLVITQVKIYV